MRLAASVAVFVFASACGAPGLSRVRFVNQDPVWVVNDRNDVPRRPENPGFSRLLYFFDAFFYNKLVDPLKLREHRRAMNVNAVDEVPDSTWFTNRGGAIELSAEEVARGPNAAGGPKLPFTVRGTKIGGRSVGFLVKDARGEKYIVKFDEPHEPLTETAADVVVQRLMWASGYNVPEDSIVSFSRDDLILADDATVEDTFGNSSAMTAKDLDSNLAKVNVSEGGSYRALASKFLPGVPIGGFSQEGVRPDDPNDLIPHEHRREVRGLYVFFSWLQATDVKVDNTLDIWTADPDDPDHHYVVHYLVDFGKSLGANGSIPRYAPDGHAPRADFGVTFASLFSVGLWRRPWEGTREPDLPGIGLIDVEHFEPDGYAPQQPYRPFDFFDRFDGYWAAKIVMRLSPELIRAAVEQGMYPDERSAEYLVKVLIGRQKKLARHWFRQVNPIDGFEVSKGAAGVRLCFDDLLLAHGLASKAELGTRWRVTGHDRRGTKLGGQVWATVVESPGRACASVGQGTSDGGYTIVRIETIRPGAAPAVEVHIATGEDGPRLIGVHRR